MADKTGFRHDLSVSIGGLTSADDRASLIESHETGATVAISDESGRLTVYGWEIDARVIAATGQKGTIQISKVQAGSVIYPWSTESVLTAGVTSIIHHVS